MKKVILIYDDSVEVSDKAKTVIGNKSYGEMIIKRTSLSDSVKKIAYESGTIFLNIKNIDEFENIKLYESNSVYFHLISNAAVVNISEFKIILEKLSYINETTLVANEYPYGIAFSNQEEYLKFLELYKIKKNLDYEDVKNTIKTNALVDLKNYNELLLFISSGFDARYFNNLQGDNYTITKKSKDKKKMKMEYSYYWLLPEDMKSWMVMPFDYKEEEDSASYKMERMPMTDVAIRWTHNAIDQEEFERLLDKVFHFFSIRHEQTVTKEEYKQNADKLYIDKVKSRNEQLKKCKEFNQINTLIANGTKYKNIDEILELYYNLYEKLSKNHIKSLKKYKKVIGHGDVFFANMLYSKEINLLRLIDPKGALEEKDLWTDPYYDIAKLSHSICGNYDFFNSNLYDIYFEKNMQFKLKVFFDNKKYKEIFKNFLKKNDYDYNLVRIYEASLFLSMLPLHIDNPHKVFGFILNAIEILKEVENNV